MATPDPVPTTPKPAPRPTLVYPVGVDKDIAAALFGVVTTDDSAGGTLEVWQVTESVSVSKFWIDEGKKTEVRPRLIPHDLFGDREYFTFSDGRVYWRPNANASFRRLAV